MLVNKNIRSFAPIFLFSAYFLVVLAVFLTRPFEIKTDIMDILPESGENSLLKQEALKSLSQEYTAKVNILFINDDLNVAKEAGIYFQEIIKRKGLEVQFSIEQDTSIILKFLSEYNYHLLSDNYRESLEQGNYDYVVDNAMALLYIPFKANVLSLDNDPFLLVPDFMMNLGLIKTGFAPNMGVLSANIDNKSYAYMIISLDKSQAFSPSYLLPTVEHIKFAQKETITKFPNVQINMTGVPVHSYDATSNTAREINLITIVSILLILIVSYAIFKSAGCFLYAVLTIGISFSMAFAITSIIFGQIHVLVLVFGASLIGLCIDYHVHYYVERAYFDDAKDALEHIKKAIKISLITGIMGFVVMMLSGISIIVSMGAFAILGLLNAYVIIRFIYPIIFKNVKVNKIPLSLIKLEQSYADFIIKIFHKNFYIKIIAIIAISVIGIFQLNTSDSIKDLYKPNDDLLKSEILFAKVSKMGSAPLMLIIKEDNEQKVLEKEEAVREFLDELVLSKDISGYKSLSQISPSIKRQNQNYELVEKLFDKKLNSYSNNIGFDDKKSLEIFANQKTDFITLDKIFALPTFSFLKSFFIKDNGFISIVLIENATNKNAITKYVNEKKDIILSDKLQDMSDILKNCREQATYALIATMLIIFGLIFAYYKNIKQAFFMVSPCLLSVMMTLGVMGFIKINISIFHILALFLVICFGIDYSIFRLETKDRIKHSGIAIFISCITTMASFGALAFTSFAVTQTLGIVLSIGIALAYLLSPLSILNVDKS